MKRRKPINKLDNLFVLEQIFGNGEAAQELIDDNINDEIEQISKKRKKQLRNKGIVKEVK